MTARESAIEAIRRVRDPRMWRIVNGDLHWRGETPDGNEIETESPLVLLDIALKELEA